MPAKPRRQASSGDDAPRGADAARATRAVIDLANLVHNLGQLRDVVANSSGSPPKIWGVVKADGYGHGGPAVARALHAAGVDGLCVALLEEGLELRAAGVHGPVLVMGGYYGRYRDGLEALIEHDLTPVVYDPDQLDRLADVVADLRIGGPKRALPVHLKVDTGMGRLGAAPDALGATLEKLQRRPELSLTGLMSHLANADHERIDATNIQLRRFAMVEAQVRGAGLQPAFRHVANSAATLRFPTTHLDAVRTGLALYGVDPTVGLKRETSSEANLRPVMKLLTEIVALRDIANGDSIGYGHRWTAERLSRIATLPMGYADGLDRRLSHRGEVLIHGMRAPIVGTVSMDSTMIDVTDVPDVALRDEVVVLGQQAGRCGADAITAHELATHTETIAWDTLTSISRRVPRFYRGS